MLKINNKETKISKKMWYKALNKINNKDKNKIKIKWIFKKCLLLIKKLTSNLRKIEACLLNKNQRTKDKLEKIKLIWRKIHNQFWILCTVYQPLKLSLTNYQIIIPDVISIQTNT